MSFWDTRIVLYADHLPRSGNLVNSCVVPNIPFSLGTAPDLTYHQAMKTLRQELSADGRHDILERVMSYRGGYSQEVTHITHFEAQNPSNHIH